MHTLGNKLHAPKKIALAMVSTLAFLSAQSAAIELYKDDKNTINLGGYFDIRYVDADNTTEFNDGTSRYNFSFTRQLKDGWTGIALVEWGVQLASNPDGLSLSGDGLKGSDDTSDSLWLRRGFIGASHEKYGKITVGKQWSSVYNIAGATDILPVFGGNASGAFNFGTDGGFSGVGRAEQALQYNHQFGDFKVSAQYQATDEVISLSEGNFLGVPPEGELSFDDSYGASIIYQSPFGVNFGAGLNIGEVDYKSPIDDGFTEDDKLLVFHVTYGGFEEEGAHLAIVYSDMENHELTNTGRVMSDSQGIEAVLSYRFDNNIIIHTAYNGLDDDSKRDIPNVDEYELSYFTFGGTYFWDPKVNFFFEMKLDESTDENGSDSDQDDVFAVGMKYAF